LLSKQHTHAKVVEKEKKMGTTKPACRFKSGRFRGRCRQGKQNGDRMRKVTFFGLEAAKGGGKRCKKTGEAWKGSLGDKGRGKGKVTERRGDLGGGRLAGTRVFPRTGYPLFQYYWGAYGREKESITSGRPGREKQVNGMRAHK